jgi:hypothetical protein
MQWCHPKRLLMSSAAGGRRQPASRHQSCNTSTIQTTGERYATESSPLVRGPQSAYMSRCQQVVPEGKDDKPQRPGELVPLHNVVALLVVLPLPPRASPPPDEVGN